MKLLRRFIPFAANLAFSTWLHRLAVTRAYALRKKSLPTGSIDGDYDCADEMSAPAMKLVHRLIVGGVGRPEESRALHQALAARLPYCIVLPDMGYSTQEIGPRVVGSS